MAGKGTPVGLYVTFGCYTWALRVNLLVYGLPVEGHEINLFCLSATEHRRA